MGTARDAVTEYWFSSEGRSSALEEAATGVPDESRTQVVAGLVGHGPVVSGPSARAPTSAPPPPSELETGESRA